MSKDFWFQYRIRSRLIADIAESIYHGIDGLNAQEILQVLHDIGFMISANIEEIEKQEKEREKEDE